MTTPDGHVLVYRPAIGRERRKDRLWGLPRALGLFFVVAWPITILVLIGIVVLVDLAFRALSR